MKTQLAVTVEVDGKVLQFLPAIRAGENFKISNSDGSGWSNIRPRVFAESLSKANSALGYKLIPTIKLAKAIIARLPDQRKLTGYHVESLALNVFEHYEGANTPRQMLKHFFNEVSARVLQPIPDVTGQSSHVDEYLGEAGSLRRRVIADAYDRIARRPKSADGAKDLSSWKQLYGED